MRYSACIEWLFAAESDDVAERIRLAAKAGLSAVEFWHWQNKPLDAIRAALDDTGLPLAAFVSEPMLPLTDPACHDGYVDGLKRSLDVARMLGAPVLIAQAGADIAGVPRDHQRAALVEGLTRCAEVLNGSGVVLALEPLNTLVDHVGYFLPSTVEGLDIVDEVGRPEIRLLYDLYHSAVMGEDIADVLAGRLDRVVHCHLADVPGRHQPGSGSLDWQPRVAWLAANGYSGFVGLEYQPTLPTVQSLAAVLATQP